MKKLVTSCASQWLITSQSNEREWGVAFQPRLFCQMEDLIMHGFIGELVGTFVLIVIGCGVGRA